MTHNSFGKAFCLTTFGESHGAGIGGVIDGCPARLPLDLAFIQNELNRRRPAQSPLTTPRPETDTIQILSGVFEGQTTGAPIAFFIKNENQRPADYDLLKDVLRPSHADYTYLQKYGIRDHRGGGRASARETAARVAAGAIAKLLLLQQHITITAYTHQISNIVVQNTYKNLHLAATESSMVRCPCPTAEPQMIAAIQAAKTNGDSLGGIVSCVITGVPAGLGEPVFDRLEADLAKAMLSINATKGFEIGSGFAAAAMHGSQHNDAFFTDDNNHTQTQTNHSGGVQGGISNGQDIYFNTAFKPTATIAYPQQTTDIHGKPIQLQAQGRHDPCVVPRAVPIVEAMAALVVADHLLRQKINT
jgi:chorismate synthase